MVVWPIHFPFSITSPVFCIKNILSPKCLTIKRSSGREILVSLGYATVAPEAVPINDKIFFLRSNEKSEIISNVCEVTTPESILREFSEKIFLILLVSGIFLAFFSAIKMTKSDKIKKVKNPVIPMILWYSPKIAPSCRILSSSFKKAIIKKIKPINKKIHHQEKYGRAEREKFFTIPIIVIIPKPKTATKTNAIKICEKIRQPKNKNKKRSVNEAKIPYATYCIFVRAYGTEIVELATVGAIIPVKILTIAIIKKYVRNIIKGDKRSKIYKTYYYFFVKCKFFSEFFWFCKKILFLEILKKILTFVFFLIKIHWQITK